MANVSKFLILFIQFFCVNLQAQLELGIDVLQRRNFSDLKGKKVALLTNTSAVDNKGKLTLDIFLESKVCQLKIVLLPEHNGGFDDQKLEELKKKNINVYCTHTATNRSPQVEWLKDVDVVVSDMQGIGMRYHTNDTSTIYAMIKAFEAGKNFMILDRPNPLGDYIGGPTMDKKYLCFLGIIPGEPLFHGMTIAEKANYIKNCGENFEVKCTCGMKDCMHGVSCNADTLKKGTLIIVKMSGWKRENIFSQTNLYTLDSKINISPFIQNVASIFDYASISFSLLLASASINFLDVHKNPKFPEKNFKTLASPYIGSSAILDNLKKQYPTLQLGYAFTPSVKIERVLPSGKKEVLDCLEMDIKDFSKTVPALINLVLVAQAQEWVPECDWETFEKTNSSTGKIPLSGVNISEVKTDPQKMENSSDAAKNSSSSASARDLKKLIPTQQKALKKAKWDRLTRLQKDLFPKHIGDEELISKLFEGESIDIGYFRNKWAQSATDFRDRTKKYYLY